MKFSTLKWKIKKRWWDFFSIHERQEYKRFIEQCKKEQIQTRKERLKKMHFDVYPLMEGMLPKNWQRLHPKETRNHFNDFKWPKKL